jgi:NhaP-type Na+/H+ or K+/H+ antiporter
MVGGYLTYPPNIAVEGHFLAISSTLKAAMEPPELFILGLLLLVGWFAHELGRFVHIPRVTILLLLGIIAGPSALRIIPLDVAQWFPLITHIALAMVGFLLGESFAGREIKESGLIVRIVSIGATLGAALIVGVIVLLVQGDLVMALLVAGIALLCLPLAAPTA